jgi:hypothetical protein
MFMEARRITLQDHSSARHHKFCLDTGGFLGSKRYLSGQRTESFLKQLHDFHVPFHIEHNGQWLSWSAFVALPPGDVAHLRVYPLRGGAPKKREGAKAEDFASWLGALHRSPTAFLFVSRIEDSRIVPWRFQGPKRTTRARLASGADE